MAEGRKKFPKIVVGPGVAAYAYVHKPDTGKKYSDDKFKVTLVLDGDADMSAVEKAAKEAAKLEWDTVPKGMKMPFRVRSEDPDEEEKEEFRGKITIVAKSQYAPGLVDAKKQPLASGVLVYSGDLVKMSGILFPYKNKDGKGVSMQLRNVQLLEKRNFGGNAADDFDEEDYEAPTGRGSRNDANSSDSTDF